MNIVPVLRAEPKFELRTRAFVTGLVYDRAGQAHHQRALPADMKTGEEYEQDAGIVILVVHVFGNTRPAIPAAGVGEPYDLGRARVLVGKNYCYQFEAGGEAFFEGREFNPFMGGPGMSIAIDDFNGEYDHFRSRLLRRRLSSAPMAARRRSRAACCRRASRAEEQGGSRAEAK